ncbi:hypothetical protein IJH16_02640 [Candidatus Saccharibacteria bacterium]|nr:hypothetical protein [Candidatus Saccharibacteria bacterium]
MFRQQTVRKVFVKLEPLLFPFSRRYPLSYVYAGWYGWNGRSLNEQGLSSFWWSTLANDSADAYYLGVTREILDPQLAGSKLYGYSLRYASGEQTRWLYY